MSKKSGLLPLITGLIAGAAAVFFSDEKNRNMAKEQVSKAATAAKEFKKRIDEDPDKTIDEVVTAIKTKAKRRVKRFKSRVKQLAKTQKTPSPKA